MQHQLRHKKNNLWLRSLVPLSECRVWFSYQQPFRQLPQCPGGRPPPEGCRKRGSGMVSGEDEPGVWPCSCAARWRVRSEKPQSGNTFPLSPGCKRRCSCPGDRGYTKKCSSTCKKWNFCLTQCSGATSGHLNWMLQTTMSAMSDVTYPPAGLLDSLFHPVVQINDVKEKVWRLQHLLPLENKSKQSFILISHSKQNWNSETETPSKCLDHPLVVVWGIAHKEQLSRYYHRAGTTMLKRFPSVIFYLLTPCWQQSAHYFNSVEILVPNAFTTIYIYQYIYICKNVRNWGF